MNVNTAMHNGVGVYRSWMTRRPINPSDATIFTVMKVILMALKILPNVSKMARAGQRVDTSFSSHYYSFVKTG